MASIETRKHTIESAFRESFYSIPDYQREYVWTNKEVYQLLNDIQEQIESDSNHEYFVGTILVSPTPSEYNYCEVIDGQQRLTTFFLLLCALKHLFEGKPQSAGINNLISNSYTNEYGEMINTLKLDLKYENAEGVLEEIIQSGKELSLLLSRIQLSDIGKFGSIINIISAYETIYHYLSENYKNGEELKKYWGHLATKIVFIQISTDISNALKIFETINERGVGLNPMDLLKNLLFKQVKKEDFEKLKNEWKKLTNSLEKNKEKPLRFLRYFIMANYKINNDRNDHIIRENEIYDWFNSKDGKIQSEYGKKPFEFVKKLNNNVDRYLWFISGNSNDNKPDECMYNLKSLTGGSFSIHYILLMAAYNLPKYLFDYFVAQLEIFLFYYIFTKTATKELERNFSNWADEIRELSLKSDSNEQKNLLNKFVQDNFNKAIFNKNKELIDALNRLSMKTMQIYRIRYLLAKITKYVDSCFRGDSSIKLNSYLSLEIEHILPNNPDNELLSYWEKENPIHDYNDYKNRLGNLTLLEKPINIVASNNFYEFKTLEYLKSANYLTRSLVKKQDVGIKTSINRINGYLQNFSDWNSNSIEDRQHLLTNLALEIFKININS